VRRKNPKNGEFEMNKVYVLQHVITYSAFDDNTKLIGVYSSENAGRSAIGRLKSKPGFIDSRGEFHLEGYELDLDHWVEGFVSGNPSETPDS
jgi:hypothetical protein